MRKIILMLFICLIPQTAHADWIMLNNGDRLSGKVISENASEVTIETEMMGNLILPRSKIASVHTGSPPRVLARELRTGQPMSSPVVAVNTNAAPETKTAEAAPAKEGKVDGKYKWAGRISAGGNVQDGNSNSTTLTADADVKARDKKNRFNFGGEINWAEDEGEKTDNDQQVYANYDRFVTEKWFIGGRQSFEKDEFEELDLRSQTGLFVGHQFFEQDDLNLQVKAGPDYIYERFENNDTESDLALSWALDYDQKVTDTAQIFHKHELSTPFADTNAFLFESESGVRVPIGERLDASAQIDFDWDNDPAPGIRENDTTYAVKIGYGWD